MKSLPQVFRPKIQVESEQSYTHSLVSMSLNHDNYGFLIGSVDQSLPTDCDSWRDIAKDVRMIRLILGSRSRGGGTARPVSAVRFHADKGLQPASRSGSNRERGVPVRVNSPSFHESEIRQVSARTGTPRDVVAEEIHRTRTRDSNGRFASDGQSSERQSQTEQGSEHGRDERGRFTGDSERAGSSLLLDAIGGAASRITGAIDSNAYIDPAIAATREALAPVRAIATPIKGAVGMFMSLRTKKGDGVPWYKKIWRELRLQRTDENAWNRRQLEAIRESGQSGGGSSTWLFALLGGLASLLTGLFSKFMNFTGLGGIIAKALSAILPNAIARRLLGGLGGSRGSNNRWRNRGDTDIDRDGDRRRGRNRRRDPPVPPEPPITPDGGHGGGRGRRGGRMRGMRGLGWLAAGAALFGAASVEADESLTREEKNQEHGASAGVVVNGAAGALAGAAIGQVLIPIPGVGAAIGSLVGGFAADYFTGDAAADIGVKIADWVGQAPLTDLPGRIVGKVGEWTQELKDSALGQWFKDTISPWLQSLIDSDIGKFVKDKWESLTDGIKSTWDSFSKTLEDTWGDLKEGAKKKLEEANDWVKEKTGIDVGGALDTAGKAVADTASSAYSYAKDTTSEVITGRKSSVNERWQKAKADIVEAAKSANVDAGVMASIAHFESSGFNPNARPVAKDASKNTVRQFDGTMAISSAHGYGQFLDGTWADYINKYGAKYGVADAGKLTKDQAAKYRGDTRLQASMLAEFTRENVELGRKLGGKDDLANVYALHNLGSGDGNEFLKALNSSPNKRIDQVLSQRVIFGNQSLYGSGSLTVAEAYARMGEKMREGESYAREAHNLQYGIASPTPEGMAGSVVNAASSAYSLGKNAYDNGKAWLDGKMPASMQGLRVKGSDGKTKTLDSMGISAYSDLQSKGGQAFEGGYNDPATLYATNLIQHGLGTNFDRVTAQNDAYHNAKSPKSGHTKGNKTDFTVKGMSGEEADRKTAEILSKYGLQRGVDFETINEYDNPSAKATGGHIDFKLNAAGQAKIAQVMAMEQMIGKAATAASAKSATVANKTPSYPGVASASLASVKPVPEPPAIPASPSVSVEAPKAPPSSSSASAQVRLPNFAEKAGRDIPDRLIAHIVTGGVAG